MNKITPEKPLLLFFTSANLKKLYWSKSRLESERRTKHRLEVNTLTESIEVQLISQRKEEAAENLDALMILNKVI